MRSASGMSRTRKRSLSRRVISRGLVAHAADDQVDPLVGGELAAELRYSSRSNVAIWIGVSLSIQNGFLPLLLLVVLEAHVDLRPDAARQEPLEVADVVRRDMDELVAEVVDLGPVVRVDEADLHLVDERVASPSP